MYKYQYIVFLLSLSQHQTLISSESTKRDFTVFSPLVTHESTKKLLTLKSLYYLQEHKYGSALHTCTHELFSFIYSIIQPPPPPPELHH